MPNISIIIVTYNAMKWAERCFSSLRTSSVPVTTYVIDNGSTDGTQDYILNHFPEVNFTQSPENLGFGKANNLGIEKAYEGGADFFYLMNQDAWLYEDSLQKLLDAYLHYDNKDELGIISPMHLNGTEKQLDIFLDKYIATNFKNRMISDLYCNTLQEYYEIDFVNAAHWLLPKSTIENVGGFNPYFFHYGEDNEYVNRVKYQGKKIILVPASKVVHDGKQQLDKVDYTLYKNLSIETKMMNPALANSIDFEIKELKKSVLKAWVTRNKALHHTLKDKLKKIKREKSQLATIKAQLTTKGPHFLKLTNHG